MIYLAGPITGLSHGAATTWRRYIVNLLEPEIKCFSPLRGKEFLTERGKIHAQGYDHPLATAKAIMTRDRFDAMRCKLMIVNLLGAKKAAIGTIMEIAWADSVRIPIICAIEREGNVHDHVMIQEAIGFRVESLKAAAEIAKSILL